MFNHVSFAESSFDISIGDNEITIPKQYKSEKASEKVKENMACMFNFLEDKVLKTGTNDDLFRALKKSGYKFNLKVDRYDPKEDLVSDEDPKDIKRIEEKLKRYAQEKGLKGEDVLDTLYSRLTDDDKMNDYYSSIPESVATYDEIKSFYEDRKVKVLNKRRREQKGKVVTRLRGKTLDVKIPDIQNLWCKEGYQNKIGKELIRQILRETRKDITATTVKRLERMIELLDKGLGPDCETCNEEEKLKQLRIKSFRGYTFDEESGRIYDPQNRLVVNDILKKELYSYFYEKRMGLLSSDGEPDLSHIRPYTMLTYKVRYFGIGKDRKKCILGTLHRDRTGKLITVPSKKICIGSSTKLQFYTISSMSVDPKGGTCPYMLSINPVTRKCERPKPCDFGYIYNFRKDKCLPKLKCEVGYILNSTSLECIKANPCKEGQEYNKYGECVAFCELGYFRYDGENCERSRPQCDGDAYFDPYYKECISMPECGENEYFDIGTAFCENSSCKGDKWSHNGKCVEMNKCDEGQIYNYLRNACEKNIECEDGHEYNLTQRKCIKVITAQDCTENQYFSYQFEKCIDKKTCEDGKVLNLNFNECEGKVVCNEGYVRIEETNTCRKILECGGGKIFNMKYAMCVEKPDCPEGFEYAHDTNGCKPITPLDELEEEGTVTIKDIE